LLSYSADIRALYRRAAHYVDRILKGAKPADLPIEQPTRFDLVVNMKTAKALGLTMPPEIMVQATRVIQ
jgi:putative ABC transport system substrate-binding protein